MGIISRYPLRPVAARLPGKWMGTPQVFQMTFATQLVTLVNIHAINISGGSDLLPTPSRITYAVRQREAQAQVLHTFAATHPFPLIVAGDFNTGDQSRAYAILTKSLVDSWKAGGWGFGHTFPGFIYTGDVFPYGDHVPFPFWMIRIDYIFHSSDWRVVSVQTGPWSGSSDHRPVVAKLVPGSGNDFYQR
jgi:endonuclease/exonuclease/phosphatase (EEP) superfamily protein YafD